MNTAFVKVTKTKSINLSKVREYELLEGDRIKITFDTGYHTIYENGSVIEDAILDIVNKTLWKDI